MNRICLVSWFHLAVSLVNICRMTLLLMERCWSLSEYVVTIFTAFSFAFDSWFFFSSACSVLYPKLEVAIPLSTHHPSPIASPSTSTATKCLQYPSSSRMEQTQLRDVVVCLSLPSLTLTLQTQCVDAFIRAAANRLAKLCDVQIA